VAKRKSEEPTFPIDVDAAYHTLMRWGGPGAVVRFAEALVDLLDEKLGLENAACLFGELLSEKGWVDPETLVDFQRIAMFEDLNRRLKRRQPEARSLRLLAYVNDMRDQGKTVDEALEAWKQAENDDAEMNALRKTYYKYKSQPHPSEG
jgi:hypothetical protein